MDLEEAFNVVLDLAEGNALADISDLDLTLRKEYERQQKALKLVKEHWERFKQESDEL